MSKIKNNFRLIGIFLMSAIAFTSASLLTISKANRRTNEVSADAASYYSNINASSAEKLYNSLVTLESSAKVSSYDNLFNIYKTAYLKSNGKLKDYYSDSTSFDPNNDKCGNYNSEGDCYNREHSIPKSWWGGTTSQQGADPFIVIPTDGHVNGMRSNFALGIVSNVTKRSTGCKYGTGVFGSKGSQQLFEPMDSVKGDLARIIFYSRVRWPNVPMNSGNGNLVFSGSQSTNYGLTKDAIDLYSSWSALDPVDEWEVSVNNAIQSDSAYGNRNPFIDHPEWINTIWGGTTQGDVPIVHSVSLSTKTKTLKVGESFSISATSSANSPIVWSKDSNLVNLSTTSSTSGTEITVTAVSEGSATIYAASTIEGKQYKDSCVITITNGSGGSSTQDDVSGTYSIVPSDLANGKYETSDTTHENATGELKFTTKYCANFSNKIQFKGGSGYLYNNDSLNLKSLKINGLSGTINVYAGLSKKPTSNEISPVNNVYDLTNYNYFYIEPNNNAAYATSIEVTLGNGSAPIDSISFDKTNLTLEEGSTGTISVTSSGPATYTSSDSSVASVSVSGSTLTIAAIKEGTTTITGTCGTETATCLVTVTPKPVIDEGGDASIVPNDLATTYETTATEHTSANGQFKFMTTYCANFSTSIQFKKGVGVLCSKEAKKLSSITLNNLSGSLSIFGSNTFGDMGTLITSTTGVYDLNNYSYFYIANLSTGVATCSSIDICFANETSPVDPSTETATINFDNCNLLTSEGTSVLYKAYSYGNSKSLSVTWGSGAYKNTSYNEISFTKNYGYLKAGDKTFVNKITIDMYYQSSYESTYSVYANGQLVTGTLTDSSSSSRTHEFIINSSDWEIKNETGYSRHFYSFNFEIDPVKTFAGHFMDNIICDNGVHAPDVTMWGRMADSYNLLTSEAKSQFVNASINESGSLVEQCVARYDYIVGKYGSASYTNFMARNPVSHAHLLQRIVLNENTYSTLIAIIIVASTTTIGLVYISKKKKAK